LEKGTSYEAPNNASFSQPPVNSSLFGPNIVNNTHTLN
jgi:hypothetical protein